MTPKQEQKILKLYKLMQEVALELKEMGGEATDHGAELEKASNVVWSWLLEL